VADRVGPHHTSVVLFASAHEWSFRAIETALAPSGYTIVRAHTGRDALERARTTSPDIIIIDVDLAEPDGLTVCQALRSSPRITRSTPILLVTPSPTPRQRRLHAIRAGVSECISLPIDSEEFALRLEALVAAKRDADVAREEGLVDNATGLYNARGLTRRALELGSHAYRRSTALACVVFAPEIAAGTGASLATVMERIAKAFGAVSRASDAAARLSASELAIVAPDTDGPGAVRLAERLALAVEQAGADEAPPADRIRLRAGYAAVPNFREASLDPARLLEHATSALRSSAAHPTGGWIRPFEGPVADHP
jgi:PleD family two-component response regulator